ncbi:protein SDA1 isoform X1 [Cinnamomum micranthum f. kanehirae]|uniref:Protein SDA1 n=1 Tax=Cinnamomum micranthum f. kanehirae TaxID=337451 RepID=A0A443Q1V1_9MAGN|nr:protein SDA1 isoform X1 [Cinnamomum micranthum f. kanehirae]
MMTSSDLTAESLSASGRSAEKLSLPSLQSKMKCDPEGYESELRLLHRHFHSSLHLFHHQSSLNLTSSNAGVASDPAGAKDLGELTMFLAHVTPFYPKHLADFPQEVADLLRSAGRSLPSSLRCQLAQALILLVNRKTIDIGETLALFMELQILGDRALRKLAFSHVVHSIRRMNQKHKNEAKNRELQNILYAMLQEEDELRAKRSLVVLCDLHRRRVWFDDRTANAICAACFHTSSRIMISVLSFLLGYERIEDGNDSDDSSDEDDAVMQNSQFVLSREAVYKAHHKGTSASKKKKQAKLQRVVRNIKRKQRMSSENNSSNYYSPLTHLKDAQGFVEKLFSRLQTCNERFEVKMMMLKVIARTVGLHKLILLNFYPFLQKYVQPHQRDITNLLAAAVQACHDMVPPDAVESLFRQIVNQFVHDHSRTEAIAVGLNVVREICLRMPLLMTEDLLQDLVLYKKSHEKAVSTAARSLITLFREVCPSLLVKKDRGRPTDPKARPKAFGEVNVASNVPGAELLQCDSESASDRSDDEEGTTATDDEQAQLSIVGTDGVSNLIAGDASLRALKRLAVVKMANISSDATDGILSNEDFRRIKVLKAKKDAKVALTQQGLIRKGSDSKFAAFKMPSSDELSVKRVDPSKLEMHVRRKLSKEERLALVKAGREERGKYQARAAVKQKKTGGLSNRQKEHKKAMPLAAKRAKVTRSRQEKKKQQKRAGKQFRGKKAWK